MRKSILMIAVVMMLMACGGQTKKGTLDADSTQVFEVPDTLNTVEAVVKQVNAVYAYWNKQREHYDENTPSVDERFGTKEWLQVREDAWAADRDCECGGFFDFGDEGPLDPWTYDCYEGYVSANDIEAKILSNGTADVKFLVKDAVTTKGIPMRWQMRVEDGEWRVANIIFENDGGIDLLASLRDYGREFKDKEAVRAFVEKFYKEWDGEDILDYSYPKQYITPNLLKYLADEYDYDCEGECLATWKFFYEGGGDVGELKSRQITARDANHVLVENKYDNYEYDVLLKVIKDGDAFKIDSLEQERSEYTHLYI